MSELDKKLLKARLKTAFFALVSREYGRFASVKEPDRHYTVIDGKLMAVIARPSNEPLYQRGCRYPRKGV